MKTRFFAALLLAALTLLSGCAVQAAAPTSTQSALTVVVEPTVPLAAAPVEAPATPAEVPTAPAEAPAEVPAASTEAPAEPNRLSKEEAIAIALADAGFTENQVSRLKAEFDYDDGRPEYEVEFRKDGFEYDYEIHAETGKILHKDKDWDD